MRLKVKKYLNKIILMIFIIFYGIMLAIGNVTIYASSKQENKKAMSAYKKKLSTEEISWGNGTYLETKDCKFSKVDVNGDGIKELVVSNDQAAHMDGYIRIFTYKRGKVRSLGHFTEVKVYKGLIKDEYSNQGCGETNYYQFLKNGKFKKIAQENCDMWVKPRSKVGPIHVVETPYGTEYHYGWRWNGRKVSYKVYRSQLKKLKRKTKSLKCKFYSNTAENRNKYLK